MSTLTIEQITDLITVIHDDATTIMDTYVVHGTSSPHERAQHRLATHLHYDSRSHLRILEMRKKQKLKPQPAVWMKFYTELHIRHISLHEIMNVEVSYG